MKYCETRVLPYTDEQLFDIVADIERYPEFVPGWLKAHIVRRHKNDLFVDQQMGLGPIRHGFDSKAKLVRPRSIHITSSSNPFKLLDIHWGFESESLNTCRLTLTAEFKLRSIALDIFLRPPLQQLARQLLTLFEKRARSVYS